MDAILILPLALQLIRSLHKRASFKLCLLHLFAFSIVTSPYITLVHYTSILSLSCILATWNLLLSSWPLLASVTFMIALNLDLTLCLPLTPVFLVYMVGTVIVNSPSAYIVKQVDYIVWRVIILIINCTVINGIIWWPYITTLHQLKNNESEEQNEKQKLSFDMTPARRIISEHLLPIW